jgi:hypothetical protein
MRGVAIGLVVLAVALTALAQVAPAHPANLQRAELDSQLPLPLASISGLLGLLLLAHQAWQAQRAAAARRPVRAAGPALAEAPARRTGDWRADLREAARTMSLEPGASLLLDQAAAPLVLRIEGAPPGRVVRAVEQLGALVATLPTPPRLRVELVGCAAPPSPWHHLVSRALAERLDRGGMKVIPQADAVDVLFLSPDPRWSSG